MHNSTRQANRRTKRSPMRRMYGRGEKAEPSEQDRSNRLSSPRKSIESVVGNSPLLLDEYPCSLAKCTDYFQLTHRMPLSSSPRKLIDKNSTVEECIRMIDHIERLYSDLKRQNARLKSELADALDRNVRKISGIQQPDDDDDLYS